MVFTCVTLVFFLVFFRTKKLSSMQSVNMHDAVSTSSTLGSAAGACSKWSETRTFGGEYFNFQ